MADDNTPDTLSGLMLTNLTAEVRHLTRDFQLLTHGECIPLTERNGSVIWIPKINLLYVQGQGNYIEIHLLGHNKERTIVACHCIGYHEEKFKEAGLVKVNRSVMVNPIHCSQSSTTTHLLTLSDETAIKIPRRKIKEVINAINEALTLRYIISEPLP